MSSTECFKNLSGLDSVWEELSYIASVFVSVMFIVTIGMLSSHAELLKTRTEGYTPMKTRSCVWVRSAWHDTGFWRIEHTTVAFWLALICAEFLVLESLDIMIATSGLYIHHTICCSKFTPPQKYMSAGNFNISQTQNTSCEYLRNAWTK